MSSIAPSPNIPVSTPAATPTTSTPAAGVSSHLQPAISQTPSSPAATPISSAPGTPAQPDALQEQIDRVLAEADTSLRFRVDEQAQRVVVSVLDGAGEVVMQIPDEAALAVARHLARHGTLLAEKA